jgi:hypothetical protein
MGTEVGLTSLDNCWARIFKSVLSIWCSDYSIFLSVRDIIIFVPYTNKEIASSQNIAEKNRLKILIFNVYQPNDQ